MTKGLICIRCIQFELVTQEKNDTLPPVKQSLDFT